uniref:HDC07564 n=1 Tax=Drosophila melanogaster TaxID=7227 RepID=Q6IM35_DROME|nr:TPA_inf: HDC07564 [Drosophila melanogaster]
MFLLQLLLQCLHLMCVAEIGTRVKCIPLSFESVSKIRNRYWNRYRNQDQNTHRTPNLEACRFASLLQFILIACRRKKQADGCCVSKAGAQLSRSELKSVKLRPDGGLED